MTLPNDGFYDLCRHSYGQVGDPYKASYWSSNGQHSAMPCLIYPHDVVIKWKHFPLYWPFVLGIHRSPVNSPHKGQWRGSLMFSFICAWIYGWANNREAGDLRRHCSHYDVIVMRWLVGTDAGASAIGLCVVFIETMLSCWDGIRKHGRGSLCKLLAELSWTS